MTIDEFNAKRKEMLDRAEALINDGKVNEAKALADEVKNLDAQFEAEKETSAELNMLKDQSVKTVENLVKVEDNKITEKENTEMNTSALYKQAFFNTLLGKELTPEQNTAFVHTTGLPNAKSLPIPTETLNEIWSLVSEEHAITKDIRKIFSKAVIEIPVHSAIAAGAATTVNEGAANSDEQNTFTSVTLAGKDFSKTIDISYAALAMTIEAFEAYLKQEIADGISDALADDVFATIDAGIANENKIETASVGTMTYADITGAFAKLKGVTNSKVVVYATRATVYNRLATLEDTEGHLIFQPNANEEIQGYLLGAPVKFDDSVAADRLYIGDATKVPYNVVQDIMVEQDRNIKTHVVTF
ncbi:phage major capsid protein, partial [Staphylococcus epidermidis]|uniref:phage major capsid protein n=1 Tax=Staphylococcus epidermidis TaxID=1282 RepID=UPI003DA55819